MNGQRCDCAGHSTCAHEPPLLCTPATIVPRRYLTFVLCIVLLICGLAPTPTAFAQESGAPTAAGDEPGLDIGLEDDLLLFADLPIVISATRRATPMNLTPMPVSVVTAQDIHFSGLTTIPDLLRFVPGVDVLQIDRNRFAVGVRGLHDTFSDRTLTLIDGRNATSPIFGGTEFLRLPLFVEDIEQIEVVRGPAGAAWGANAFNGAINIIKKRPRDIQGVLLSTRVNTFGDVDTQARWAAVAGAWDWRVSAGYTTRASSEHAVDDATFSSRDFSRGSTFDGEATYTLDDSSNINFGLAHSSQEQGDFEFVGFFPMRTGRLETTRAFVRVNHTFDSGATGYVQWFGNYYRTNQPSVQRSNAFENDVEAQFNTDIGENHEISVGGNVRYVHVNSTQRTVQDFAFQNAPFNEVWTGFFAIDRWHITPQFTIDSQIRVDYYTETGTDWSGRLTALYSLDTNHRHVLRLSTAKAFRAPLTAFRELSISRVPLPTPGTFGSNVQRAGNLDNEETFSIEGGYTGVIADGLTLRANAYYQRYSDLIGVNRVNVVGLQQTFEFANIDGADAYGAEVELSLRRENWSLSVWYAINQFDPDVLAQDIRAFRPARHKVGSTARVRLPGDVTLNANYRFTSTTSGENGSGFDAASSHRLDLTVAKQVAGRGELLLGITDLFNDTEQAIFGVGDFTSHETPGRTLFIRFQLTF